MLTFHQILRRMDQLAISSSFNDVGHPPGHALDQQPQVLGPQSDQPRAS